MDSMEKSIEVQTEKFHTVAGPAGEIFVFDENDHTVCVIPSTNPNAARHARLLLVAPMLLGLCIESHNCVVEAENALREAIAHVTGAI